MRMRRRRRRSGQELTTCDTVHSHTIRVRNHISCGMNYSGRGHWPVWKWLSSNHWRQWRSKPGSLMVRSANKVERTTVADRQSSCHWLVSSIVCESVHNGLSEFKWNGGRHAVLQDQKFFTQSLSAKRSSNLYKMSKHRPTPLQGAATWWI